MKLVTVELVLPQKVWAAVIGNGFPDLHFMSGFEEAFVGGGVRNACVHTVYLRPAPIVFEHCTIIPEALAAVAYEGWARFII